MSKNEQLTYEKAFKELNNIAVELEKTDTVNFDELNTKVKRAGELLKICKSHLHETEAELEKILKQLED